MALSIDKNPDRTFLVSSAYRTTGTETNFKTNLSQSILNIRSIQLEMAEFTNYICPSEGSVFNWVELSYSGSMLSFSFPADTFYTIDQLITYIQTQMNAIGTLTYSIAYNSSNYITFTANGAFSLICNKLDNNIYYILGFTPYANSIPQFITSTPPPGYTFLNSSVTAPYPFDNRAIGLGIVIGPLTTNTTSNNPTNNVSTTFYIPLTHNYTEVEYFASNKDFYQVTKYYSKGQCLYNIEVNIGLMLPGSNSINFSGKLHSDITMIFSYTTYDDVDVIRASDKINSC